MSMLHDVTAKVAMSRAGGWHAGGHGFQAADVVMIIGCNTIVSQYTPFGGIPPWNPVRAFNEAKKRGLKVISIDPRRTDLARRADYLRGRRASAPRP